MKKLIILGVIFILSSLSVLQSAPAYSGLRTETQPDGTSINYYVKGDETFHYSLSADGYVLIKNEAGFYTYAQKDTNNYLVASKVVAHNLKQRTQAELDFLKTISPSMEFAPVQRNQSNRHSPLHTTGTKNNLGPQRAKSINAASIPITAVSTSRQLVILVNFTDKSFVVNDPKTTFTNLLNQQEYAVGGATGSAKDYFTQNSNGAYVPTFDVVGPYNLPNNMAYYGADVNGEDVNPRQMVIDACQLAYNAGVDFSVYDNNNDGFVDNVFIIYAGNNQAENALVNEIWPHSWYLANYNTEFDGKIVYLYACASELRGYGTTASSISGIGTFCHEFGHVLGLLDLYDTDNVDVFCLGNWDIMDNGLYNNNGHTPPTYSSFERFSLGWLTPQILSQPISKTLPDLKDSNEAFIVASSTPNLDASNPNPTEYFLIENRQQKGFDAYAPAHGMLAWHVDYDPTDWENNTINNSSTNTSTAHQRVYIVPADGNHSSGSQTSDPFPGTLSVTSFSPTLWSGTSLNEPFTNITETNGIITFDFMGGLFDTQTPPVTVTATSVKDNSFVANWYPVLKSSGYCLTLYKILTISNPYLDKINESFSSLTTAVNSQITDFAGNGLTGWTGNYVFNGATSEPTIGTTSNALRIGDTFDIGNVTTPTVDLSANNGVGTLEFDLRIWNQAGENPKIQIQYSSDGTTFDSLTTVQGSGASFGHITVPLTNGTANAKIQFAATTLSNVFFIDNVNIYQGQKTGTSTQTDSVTTICNIQTDSLLITNLSANTVYSYVVTATDGTNTTPSSNTTSVTTENMTGTIQLNSNPVQVWSKGGILYISGINEQTELTVFQIDGKLLIERNLINSYNEIPINRNGVYVVKLKSADAISTLKIVVQ